MQCEELVTITLLLLAPIAILFLISYVDPEVRKMRKSRKEMIVFSKSLNDSKLFKAEQRAKKIKGEK